MNRRKHSRPARDIAPVHPHAAAVDIGATLHVAAVRPGCDPEPVRTFGTFTTDLHRLADWFEQCGAYHESVCWDDPFGPEGRDGDQAVDAGVNASDATLE